MFSKALFKQSAKANGTMWTIITFAVCFMLACVMLISGGGAIGDVKNSIQDTIIQKEIDSELEKRSINYYENAEDGFNAFDGYFLADVKDTLSYLTWLGAKPNVSVIDPAYSAYMAAWQAQKPVMTTDCGKAFETDINAAIAEWQSKMPDPTNAEAFAAWKSKNPATSENAVKAAVLSAANEVKVYVEEKALKLDENYTPDTKECQEILGSVFYSLNLGNGYDEFYYKDGHETDKTAPGEYDYMSIVNVIASATGEDKFAPAEEFIKSDERAEYRKDRAETTAAMFLAGNMVSDENVEAILEKLSSFGVDRKKYESFGYDYGHLKNLSANAVITYRGRLDYAINEISVKKEAGEIADDNEYVAAVTAAKSEIRGDVTNSLLASLPDKVSDALEEVGKADLYTLIVGSIFYKLAGLLLPIIFMIMASNNLIAGQVDSGSMAYVLSTSTKRKTVVFTQAVYLIGSLLSMFLLTTATGFVCLAIVKDKVSLTYGNLALLNLGAFLVLFALSGLCFLTSCFFDRSKRSMAIGGGLSIFALVAAMLGLFGSPVIPSVVRLDALNYFNYTTIISLFDVVSIIEGTNAHFWKFAILFVLGVIGYIAGSVKFDKKDLPL